MDERELAAENRKTGTRGREVADLNEKSATRQGVVPVEDVYVICVE